MKKLIPLLTLILFTSCQNENSALSENLAIELSTWEDGTQTKSSAMPVLNEKSELLAYRLRFEYLLMNIPAIHGLDKIGERDSINSLYPDTNEVRRIYLEKYCSDQKLVNYFEQSASAITNPDFKRDTMYTVDELMEVASKFFYCDMVDPVDTTVQMHICIGFNGIPEAKWNRDYTLLAAFCYEAIFTEMDHENSAIRNAYSTAHDESCAAFRPTITTPDQYLADVKADVFSRMKNSTALKEKLLAHYEANKANLAFTIVQ